MIKRSKVLMSDGIIDVHSHAGGIDMYNWMTPRYPLSQSAYDLSLKVEANDVDFFVVFPMPTSMYYHPKYLKNTGSTSLSGIEDFPFQRCNEVLLYEVDVFQLERALPFLCIDPMVKIEEQIVHLEQLIDQYEVFGLKLHTLATHSSAIDLDGSPFMELLESENLPILIHAGTTPVSTHPLNIVKLAKKYPYIRFCIAHFADFDVASMEAIVEVDNVFVDTSPFLSLCEFALKNNVMQVSAERYATDYSHPDIALRDLCQALPGKVIWGTDEPWTSVSNDDGSLLTRYSYSAERSLLAQLSQGGHDRLVSEISNWNTKRFLFGNNYLSSH